MLLIETGKQESNGNAHINSNIFLFDEKNEIQTNLSPTIDNITQCIDRDIDTDTLNQSDSMALSTLANEVNEVEDVNNSSLSSSSSQQLRELRARYFAQAK